MTESRVWIPSPGSAWPKSDRITGPWSPAPPGLPMFGCVAEGSVYRSGQPTREGFERLARQGVKSVVSLRQEGEPDGLSVPIGSPLQLHRLAWEDEKAPSLEVAQQWLTLASRADLWPLLVHCAAGRGRTSVAAALCRYSFDGWSMEKAREEIWRYRFGIDIGDLHIRKPLAAEQKRFLASWQHARPPGDWERTGEPE